MILITGCSGFIGYHLCNFLLKKNKKIIGIDNLNSYYDRKLKIQRLINLKRYQNFKFFNKDVTKFVDIYKLTRKYKFKIIIHLAAQPGVRYSLNQPNQTLYNNLNSFNNVIEIARLKKVKKFIYASSSSVYGEVKKFPFTEDDYSIRPISVYGASKLSNEIVADVYSKNFKLKCVGLRFFTVYGPYGRPDMAYYSFLNSLKNNKTIKVFNNGNMLRDFTYIDDVIYGIIKVIKAKFTNMHEVLNIGKGNPDKLMDLINYLEENYFKKFKINFTKNIPLGDIKKTYSDVNKAKKIINWQPKISLKVGIKKFVKWYKSNKI